MILRITAYIQYFNYTTLTRTLQYVKLRHPISADQNSALGSNKRLTLINIVADPYISHSLLLSPIHNVFPFPHKPTLVTSAHSLSSSNTKTKTKTLHHNGKDKNSMHRW